MNMTLKCPRKTCSHEWVYKGKRKFNTSCPRCKTTVTLNKKN